MRFLKPTSDGVLEEHSLITSMQHCLFGASVQKKFNGSDFDIFHIHTKRIRQVLAVVSFTKLFANKISSRLASEIDRSRFLHSSSNFARQEEPQRRFRELRVRRPRSVILLAGTRRLTTKMNETTTA